MILLIGSLVSPGLIADTEANKDTGSLLLEGMSSAFKTTQYDGIFIYAQGPDVQTLRIIHKVENGNEKERLIHLDGIRFELIRDKEGVICVLPNDMDGTVEHGIPPVSFAQSFFNNIIELKKNYHVKEMPQRRLLGRDIVQVSISPKSGDRYGYQLWFDKTSGLLLKSLLHDVDKNTLERFQFSSLEIGGAIPDYLFMIENPDQVRVVHIPKELASTGEIKNSGWHLSWIPTGFYSIMNDTMPMTSVLSGKLEHMQTYSDGLFSFSIFVEKIADSNLEEMHSKKGATTVISRRISDLENYYSITMVGELPLPVGRRIVNSVYKKDLPAEPAQ
ncbi:MAG: MucB/RseB C-terminal domain-containing protein [Pseudomonadales bacterium]|nr:MucB/RseB C-terminal domain-containing protein [Pseudomonadales bacterium]